MEIYIPTKEEMANLIKREVHQTLLELLPIAIQKATRKQWLTTDEVMKMLHCSRRHVQYLRDSQQLTFHQNGRTIRYRVEDIEAFLNGGKVVNL